MHASLVLCHFHVQFPSLPRLTGLCWSKAPAPRDHRLLFPRAREEEEAVAHHRLGHFG